MSMCSSAGWILFFHRSGLGLLRLLFRFGRHHHLSHLSSLSRSFRFYPPPNRCCCRCCPRTITDDTFARRITTPPRPSPPPFLPQTARASRAAAVLPRSRRRPSLFFFFNPTAYYLLTYLAHPTSAVPSPPSLLPPIRALRLQSCIICANGIADEVARCRIFDYMGGRTTLAR